MNRIMLRNGLIFGFAGTVSIALYYLALYMMGDNPVSNFEYHALWIPLIFIALGIKFYKDKNGGLRFWEGILTGMAVNFFMALLASLFIYIFLQSIAPELIQNYIDSQSQEMHHNKETLIKQVGKKNFYNQLDALKNSGAGVLASDDFIKILLVGMVYTVLSAAYFRTPLRLKK